MIIKSKDIKENLIKYSQSIYDAIYKINLIKLKFLLVVNLNNSVVGTITDGDLRRALVNHKDLNESVFKIMNKKFTYSTKKINDQMGRLILKKKIINFLPILNENKKIKYLITEDNNISSKPKKNKILFIAGGKGKRLMPLTKTTPKPLLRVKKNSIIHDLIISSIYQGFKNFIISVNYKAEKFLKIFEDGKNLNCNILYLKETKPLGTAGPITLLKKKDFDNNAMIVMNADLITNINFSELINFHNKNKNDFTVCIKNISINIPYGEIEFEKKGIKKISEKPHKSYFINVGIYAISYNAIKNFKPGYLDMNDFINILIKKKMKVKHFPIYENWHDIGNKLDFTKLKNEFSSV
jgi:dTDP-glucose pyrophosphorylase|tara:strand:- start:2898 stop:3956 length:1059 start_codon:yes stop_codon:yes gene_type:complete